MPGSIKVGVITDAAGAHLDAYLGGLSSCEGVEQVALADPIGSVFDKAHTLLAARFPKVQTFRDAPNHQAHAGISNTRSLPRSRSNSASTGIGMPRPGMSKEGNFSAEFRDRN